MDGWGKAEVVAKIGSAIVLPVVLLFLGNQFAATSKEREIQGKFVEIATGILNKDPGNNPGDDTKRLRRWATEIINRYSGVPLPRETADALITTTPLPVAANKSEGGPVGPWGVVFGGDTTLSAANHEITVTAKKIGLADPIVFLRNGSYRSVVIHTDRSAAEDTLGKARVVRGDAYIVDMGKWCSTVSQRQGYRECIAP